MFPNPASNNTGFIYLSQRINEIRVAPGAAPQIPTLFPSSESFPFFAARRKTNPSRRREAVHDNCAALHITSEIAPDAFGDRPMSIKDILSYAVRRLVLRTRPHVFEERGVNTILRVMIIILLPSRAEATSRTEPTRTVPF
jgi:hypothetical protein